MSTRTDLLAAAAGLAEDARSAAAPGDATAPDFLRASMMATAAKTALEAASLAENMSPGEIDQALGQIQDLLHNAGVLTESMTLPPGEFLAMSYRALLAWRNQALESQGYTVAYEGLETLCVNLERDFIAGDSETSRRIAARIRAALDDAKTTIRQATQVVANAQTAEG